LIIQTFNVNEETQILIWKKKKFVQILQRLFILLDLYEILFIEILLERSFEKYVKNILIIFVLYF